MDFHLEDDAQGENTDWGAVDVGAEEPLPQPGQGGAHSASSSGSVLDELHSLGTVLGTGAVADNYLQ